MPDTVRSGRSRPGSRPPPAGDGVVPGGDRPGPAPGRSAADRREPGGVGDGAGARRSGDDVDVSLGSGGCVVAIGGPTIVLEGRPSRVRDRANNGAARVGESTV